MVSPGLRVVNHWKGADSYIHASVDVGTPVSSGGIDIGGLRVLPAGLATVAVLALFPLLKLVFRGPGTLGPVFALVVAIGFWTLFAAMAQRDWRSLSAWRETTCRIIDVRLESKYHDLVYPHHVRGDADVDVNVVCTTPGVGVQR